MIKVNEDYSFERGTHGWSLYKWSDSISKDKTVKRKKHITYYTTLDGVLKAIIDYECGQCESIIELAVFLKDAKEDLVDSLVSKHGNIEA